ncbi:CHASE3 domain-containing protein [Sphingomonas sp. CFBP 13728]|uniref:sensor histidine kinase n=1 Tax=Sphingomonas sp. CFBP 13728 TaxID=2775294 RepID=UPI00178557E8|nr:sensor histidine kinase [Sphingomonas sp. CFBP 13728]MBD8619714.1 CHASE3 domain-containing protein [Sphingomonas sp. CFBP 13728]
MVRVRLKLPSSEGRVARWLVAFMTLGFIALAAAAIAIGWITVRNRTYTAEILHTQDVRQAIATLQIQMEQSETARRGYILAGKPLFATAYARTAGNLVPSIRKLRHLTRDNPRQGARLDLIEPRFVQLRALRTQSMTLVAAGRIAEAQRRFAVDASVPLMRGIRYRLQAMAADEVRLLGIRTERQERTSALFLSVAGLAAALLLIVAILAVLLIRRYTADLAASRDSLRTLNETLEEQVVERTADLSRANEEIQRFAYIVSHDLRSPLVNVMGFTAELATAAGPLAELVDRAEAEAPHILTEDARLAAREDLPEAIGFIRTSTQKMDRLINAILKLAREGRRTIAPEHIDPAQLVDTIVGALQHIVDDRGAVVRVERPMPGIVTDCLALEQILSNLIENATKYLKPGRPGEIVVKGHTERGRVILSVVDNGRGIDPRDHQRVFDLFRRSGTQDQPGEGIGLAHVRALAYRLGGTIDVQSTLGDGATFRLNLPTHMTIQDAA